MRGRDDVGGRRTGKTSILQSVTFLPPIPSERPLKISDDAHSLMCVAMSGYELNRLNDKEFEVLAVRIVQELVGKRVERFKPGKDSGVDGRFFTIGTAEGIVQAKHWERSGLAALLAHLTKTEAPKGAKLKPTLFSDHFRAAFPSEQAGHQSDLCAASSIGSGHPRS